MEAHPVELRVHGIGGTTAQSMLGAAPDAQLVPRWPLAEGAPTRVWQADDPHLAAYHWAPLTSGSRWFVFWPLLLPFTILNVAGFMLARRGPVRRVHQVLCLACTVWFGAWLVLGAALVARHHDASEFVAVAVALVVAGVIAATSWPRRAGRSAGGGLEDPAFFETGRGLWSFHAVVLVGTIVAVAGVLDGGGLRDRAEDAVVWTGAAIVVLLAVLGIAAAVRPIRAPGTARAPVTWRFRAVGAAGLGAATIGGLLTALLRVLVGNDPLRGPAFALFDVYGWSILAGVAVAAATAFVLLVRPSPGERVVEHGRRLLPNPESWFRARVALLPQAGIAGLGAAVLVFLVVGTAMFVTRRPDASFTSPDTAVVRLAQATIYGLFAFMVLNLVRSRASPDALRRVGSIWDVLTFWPRRFHPFAVRPYTAVAIPQLRELLVDANGVDDAWHREPLTVLAHSQGTMLVVAALAPYGSGRGGSCVSHLVTVGSPLRPLYMRAFPAYIDDALVRDASSALEPPARWTNVFRFTDHVGRSVFCEEPAWVVPSGQPRAGDPQGLWWVEAGPPLGPGHRDCAVADPESNQALLDGHNSYWTDRRVRGVIDGASAGHA